jgi:hypothetical protein
LQVTTRVGGVALLVLIVTLTVLEHNDIALIITVKISKNIVDIESTVILVGRNLHNILLAKVLQQVIVLHDDSAVIPIHSITLFIMLLNNLVNVRYSIGPLLQ